VIYNGSTDYQGSITINNANFKVNGVIDTASIAVCRNSGFSAQRGTLSGSGTLTGDVFVNSGTIFPDAGQTLTLGSLSLNAAAFDSLGSLVHITLDSTGTSLVAVNGAATLAGTLEIELDPSATTGEYIILTASSITGEFDPEVIFTGPTPNYSLEYLPEGSPTMVRFTFIGFLDPASRFQGTQQENNFGLEYELYSQLTWTASPSSGVAGYFVYRDDVKIATVSAATRSYEDHNRSQNVSYVYALVAFDADGNTSDPVTVTVSPK
jgi:hypothetical protein